MGGLIIEIYKYLDVLNKENDFLNFLEIRQFTQWLQKQFLQLNFSSQAYSQKSYDNMMARCIVQLGL